MINLFEKGIERLSQMGEMVQVSTEFFNKIYAGVIGQMPVTYQLDSRIIKTKQCT